MKTFFHEETGANQFALTITFAGPSGDPSVLPVLYWLSYLSASSTDVLQVFFQHPDADAQHRLVLNDDVIAAATTQEYHLDCGLDGFVVPRAAAGAVADVHQITDGAAWTLRVITASKTGDAFIDIGWDWRRVV